MSNFNKGVVLDSDLHLPCGGSILDRLPLPSLELRKRIGKFLLNFMERIFGEPVEEGDSVDAS